MCVKFERTFSTRLFPALKRSPLAQNAVVSNTKIVPPSTTNVFVFYFEGGFENPNKEHKASGKSFYKTSFQLRMGLKNDRNKTEMKEHKT